MNLLRDAPILPEDLLHRGDGPIYELVDGRLVEKPMGQSSDQVGVNLIMLLGAHVRANDLGWFFGPSCSYQVFPHAPRKVRYPDVSFIRKERMPPEGPARGHCRVAPDLAVEVVSPNDEAEELDARVKDFLRAGTRLVWVVHTRTRSVDLFRADGSGGWRSEDQELAGEDVVPGFVCRVADLFLGVPAPPAPAEPDLPTDPPKENA